jgi:hypothetical protein
MEIADESLKNSVISFAYCSGLASFPPTMYFSGSLTFISKENVETTKEKKKTNLIFISTV